MYLPVRATISLLQHHTENIRKLEAQQAVTASTTDKQVLTSQMTFILSETTRSGSTAKAVLDRLATDRDIHVRHHPNAASSEIRRNLHAKYVREFQAAVCQFHDASCKCKASLQNTTRRQLQLVGITDEKKIAEIFESGLTDEVLQQAMTEDLTDMMESIESRHASILTLERSIREAQQLFIDLAMLVDAQQDIVDHIEIRVDSAKDWGEKGAGHLRDGERYQNDAHKRQCCIFLCIVLCIVIVVVSLVVITNS